MADRLRIATRQSPLALWQANHVKALLEQAHRGLIVEMVGMTTEGDRNKRSPLSQIGGKGVFVKELEVALIEGRAEIAVHSMKDVPAELPDGLKIAAMCAREDPSDAFVSNRFASLDDITPGSTIGTSSLRRRLQLRLVRPDLNYEELRGNVDTRLRQLDDGNYDAIILATAGLKHLQLEQRISQKISTSLSIPAAGQGAIGIEARVDNGEVISMLEAINHRDTFDCVSCEREVSINLGASCNLPIAVFAVLQAGQMRLNAYVSDLAGEVFIRLSAQAERSRGLEMARSLSTKMLAKGADKLIETHA